MPVFNQHKWETDKIKAGWVCDKIVPCAFNYEAQRRRDIIRKRLHDPMLETIMDYFLKDKDEEFFWYLAEVVLWIFTCVALLCGY